MKERVLKHCHQICHHISNFPRGTSEKQGYRSRGGDLSVMATKRTTWSMCFPLCPFLLGTKDPNSNGVWRLDQNVHILHTIIHQHIIVPWARDQAEVTSNDHTGHSRLLRRSARSFLPSPASCCVDVSLTSCCVDVSGLQPASGSVERSTARAANGALLQ